MADLSSYRFTASHEWVHVEGSTATVGISDHAQAQLGDVIFLELPEVGATLTAGAKFGAIESVKAASDLYAPVGGTVTEVNGALTDHPGAGELRPVRRGLDAQARERRARRATCSTRPRTRSWSAPDLDFWPGSASSAG